MDRDLAALAARLAVLGDTTTVTADVTAATCTAAPLLWLSVVTTAVRLPAVVGLVENVHGERGRSGRGDRADRAIVEDDRVIGGDRVEA